MGSSFLRRVTTGRELSSREVLAGEIATARSKATAQEAQDAIQRPKAFDFSPTDFSMAYSGERPVRDNNPGSALSCDAYRAIARYPFIAPIIQRRLNQIAEFCVPQATTYSNGCKVMLRHLKQKMTPAAERQAREILDVMLRAGGKYAPGGLEAFNRRFMRDSLELDWAMGEVIETKGGKPWGFKALDAATMMRARPSADALAEGRWEPDDVSYVQVIDDRIVNRWRADEIFGGIRRPRTWIRSMGYGYPEPDEGITVITNILNAMTYNSVNFTNGVHASSILAVYSKMAPELWEAFKMQVTAFLHGVRNGKRLPMVRLDPGEAGEGGVRDRIESVNLSMDNEKMGYSDWLNFNFKLMCAIYQMDPAEVGFVYGTEGMSSALSSAGPGERVKYSKEGGLRPLLRASETWLNEAIVQKIDPDFHFAYVGLDSLSQKEKLELDKMAVETYASLNDVRASNDFPKIDLECADWPMNPTFQQNAMALLQQANAGDDGDQGDDGVDPRVGGNFGADWNDADDWTGKVATAMDKAHKAGAFRTRKVQLKSRTRQLLVPSTDGCAAVLLEVAA